MRRNIDAVALLLIVVFMLAVEVASNHAGVLARRTAFRSAATSTTWCPLQHMRVALHRIPAR